MSSLANQIEHGDYALAVTVSDDMLEIKLADGRQLSVPLAWFPRLCEAEPEQRHNLRLIGPGTGIHWPDLDEDLSISALLHPGARQ